MSEHRETHEYLLATVASIPTASSSLVDVVVHSTQVGVIALTCIRSRGSIKTSAIHGLSEIFVLVGFYFKSRSFLTTREAAWCINFGRVSLSVCVYVCQTITIENLGVGSSYLHMRYISTDGSSSYMKVIG